MRHLGGHLPVEVFSYLKIHFYFPIAQIGHVHKGGRDIQMRMGLINLGIGAIPSIGKKGIAYVYFSIMASNIPLVGIGSGNFQGLSLAVRGLEIVYIFRKFVQGIASRGGAAHTHRKYTGIQ